MTSLPFSSRHVGLSESRQRHMLKVLGYGEVEELIRAVIPSDILEMEESAELGEGMEEEAVAEHLKGLAGENILLKSLIGQGYYATVMPSVIRRNVLNNPAWYTAYTPYQAEISQGRLEALANFQTLVADLTALEIAGASLLDEATAAAEAMGMCLRLRGKKSFFVSSTCHPQTISVLQTRASCMGVKLILGEPKEALKHELCGVLLQYPDTLGFVEDMGESIGALHEREVVVVVATDLLALTLLKPPGEMGADIAVGSAQRFGVPLFFGGPHAGFIATKDAFKRSLPGRLIGVSKDSQGNPCYRMALQTREQHIRRQKATSNICTAQALLAILASFYGLWHGAEGLKVIASRIRRLALRFASSMHASSTPPLFSSFFDTVTLHSGQATESLLCAAREAGFNLRKVDNQRLSVSVDETTTQLDIDVLIKALGATPQAASTIEEETTRRRTSFMTHPVFHRYRNETDMMRYMRELADKDMALDRTMIPLGSCTMKLNASCLMDGIALEGFAHLHPFVPKEQARGYEKLINALEQQLCAMTGFDAFSVQPNSGANGEYAGLLAIARYHESCGQGQRSVCLIPTSAHGTNPASAHMMGMEVVEVACTKDGNLDVLDLNAKSVAYKDTLGALMITYPSTHGVFEDTIQEVCQIVHRNGGQVYMDGANMNALAGLTYPGKFGADVAHLNLHKTFAIPHGGGGPGVGPIGVKAHLAPFLPPSPLTKENQYTPTGAVAAAPFGSAGVLPISYAYILLLGKKGIPFVSKMAILAANYLQTRLASYYRVLYTGKNGLVAHECILDIRPIEKETGVTAEDISKRLMDYNFHAPTMSFPVPGTLMIEPTESESFEELERFVEAMIQIAKEIEEIKTKKAPREDNVFKGAPHTAVVVCADTWRHAYSREKAAYPLPVLKKRKVWPAVSRIDNAYGDRNIFCSCIEMTAVDS